MIEKKVKSILPIYAAGAAWVLFGLIFPLYRLSNLLIAIVVSALVYLLLVKILPERTILVEAPPAPVDTGDREVDVMILSGRQSLKKMEEVNKALPGTKISGQITELIQYGRKIFEYVEKDVSKARNIRKFMDYYLPTSLNLVENYASLKTEGIQGENVDKAVEKIESVMDTVVEAFKNQLDGLYEDQTMDIVTEVKVMESLLKREGLSGGNLSMDMNSLSSGQNRGGENGVS